MMLVERVIHGSRMWLDTTDPGQSAELLKHGTREGDAPKILARLVQKGWTCLDVGASLGFYALLEGRQGAKVYAVEANPNNVSILNKSLKLNRYDIEVYNFAAGNKRGQSRFMQALKSNRGYMADMVAHRPPGIREITVEEKTLDSFIIERGINRINLLRFDVDGYEREMLEGAQTVLAMMPPGSWIFAELHPRCFDNPVKDFQPTLENIIDHGFVPRMGVGPAGIAELAEGPAEIFARECCTTYKMTAPLIFLEKCE